MAPNAFTLQPVEGAASVSTSPELILTFDESVKLGSGTITIRPTSGGSQFVQTIVLPDSHVSVNGAVVTIRPPTNLEFVTEYFIEIDPKVINDLAGNAFPGIATTAPFAVTFQFRSGNVDEDVIGFTIDDIVVVHGTASGFTELDGSTYTATVTPDGSGNNISIDVAADVAQDAAGNLNTAATRANLSVASIQPPGFRDLDALKNGNQHLQLATVDAVFASSNLPVGVSENARPRIEFQILEQQTSTKQLIEKITTPSGSVSEVIVPSSVTVDGSGTSTIRPTSELALGQHTFLVRAIDAAGNVTNSASSTYFVSAVGTATFGAPGTPVFTTLYDVKAAINAAVGGNASDPVQPWQMSFDKTTQTVWFSTEKAGTLGQFDPATGQLNVYNLRELLDDPSNGDNPHGIFFDFNTHLTPRVWVAHRNAGGSVANVGGDLESDGRLSYLDVIKNELVTFDFADPTIKQLIADHGFNDGELPAFHAVFTDPTGDVWVSSPDAQALLQFASPYRNLGHPQVPRRRCSDERIRNDSAFRRSLRLSLCRRPLWECREIQSERFDASRVKHF